MTVQDFMMEARSAVAAYFRMTGRGDIELTADEVVKANDCRMHGLHMRRQGSAAGRYVYMDDLFDRHERGEELPGLLSEAADRCEQALRCPEPPAEAGMDLSLENVRERLSVKLLGVRNNISYMAERPYIDVGSGLAMVAVINLEPSVTSEWVISVTDGLLEEIGCDSETLLTAALENTIRLEPPVLMKLYEYVYSNCVEPGPVKNLLDGEPGSASSDGALLLTNESGRYGASTLFYPGVMDRISEMIGSGYYVIPSSIHELILIPDMFAAASGRTVVEGLKDMVRRGNEEITDREDQLSDNVFHYDPAERRLSVA